MKPTGILPVYQHRRRLKKKNIKSFYLKLIRKNIMMKKIFFFVKTEVQVFLKTSLVIAITAKTEGNFCLFYLFKNIVLY
jgi:hypothetical protein